MDNKEFYNDTFSVVLQSNGSLNYHPNNTPSNFTIQFDKHIVLQRSMELALEEIILPNNIINIPKSKIYLMAEINNVSPSNWIYQAREITLFELDIEAAAVQDIRSFYYYLLEKIITISIDDIEKKIVTAAYINEWKNVEFVLKELPGFSIKDNKITMKKGKLHMNAKLPSKTHPLDDGWIQYHLYWRFDNK